MSKPRTYPERITLQHIADEVGVDRSAVSRVLNGKMDRLFISEDKVRKIHEAAQRLGYRPNSFARSVRSGRFGCVALLLSTENTRSTLPPRLLEGIQDELARQDLHLVVARLPDEKLTSTGFVPRILRECLADGLLINYTDHIPDAMIRQIAEHRIPSVWINCKLPCDCVHPGDFQASLSSTRRLLDLGHRRIAYANFIWGLATADAHYSVADRQGGYEQAMRDAGLEPLYPLTEGVPSAQRPSAAESIISSPSRPTAFVTYSDIEAGALYFAARMAGLAVPRELSLATFTGQQARCGAMPISAMVVPNYEVGRSAVRMLSQKLASPTTFEPQQVPFALDCEDTICSPASQ